MADQINGGENNKLSWTDSCFLVLHWCAPFANPLPTTSAIDHRAQGLKDQPRILFASAEAVRKANKAIPADYEDARLQGNVPDSPDHGAFSIEGFDACRALLKRAAEQGCGLRWIC